MRSHWSPWVSLSGGERWAGGRQSGLRVDLDQPTPGRPVPKCLEQPAASPGWTGLALRAPCWRLREQQAHNKSLPIHGGCQRPGGVAARGQPKWPPVPSLPLAGTPVVSPSPSNSRKLPPPHPHAHTHRQICAHAQVTRSCLHVKSQPHMSLPTSKVTLRLPWPLSPLEKK